MTERASLVVFVAGGLVALLANNPSIAASTSAIAYVLLLAAHWG